ncbi:hypothetical protein T484DRAFT_1830006 [Baffinella frigidus]|nr:hypothetical protein T484DRAFT_1830006 [Cryptophyta sp. CCMP2293]
MPPAPSPPPLPARRPVTPALKLSDNPAFLDSRTLWNLYPVRGMPDRASEVGFVTAGLEWRAEAKEKNRTAVFVAAIPYDDPLSEPEFFVEFRSPFAEDSAAVRTACISELLSIADHEHEAFLAELLSMADHEHEAFLAELLSIADHEHEAFLATMLRAAEWDPDHFVPDRLRTLLRTAEWDPDHFVRAAAVDGLGQLAIQIRKLGLSKRWGDSEFWWQEEENFSYGIA